MATHLSTDSRQLTGAFSSFNLTNFTLSAGTNRRLFIVVQAEDGSSTDPSFSAGPTFGGVTATLVTDGTVNASAFATSGGFAIWTKIFEIRETDLPADGSGHAVTGTLSLEMDQGCVSVLVVSDAQQDANVDDVVLFTVTADTDPSLSVSVADDDSLVLSAAACGNAGTWTHGTGQTERWDQNLSSSGYCGSTEEPASAGTEATTHTFSATINRAAAVAIAVGDAASEANASGDITFASQVAGTMDSPRNASGDLSFATSLDVDADFIIEAGGGSLTFATQVDGALSVPVNLSGALAFGWSMGDGVLDVEGTVMSGAIEFAPQVSGSLSVPDDASGALAFATSLDVDADFLIEADGALAFGWSVAGSLVHVSSASGALAFGWGISGRIRTQFPGSCVLLDAAGGSAVLEHTDASFATLLDEPSGTATLEAS